MSDQARRLTDERGNLNVHRPLAHAGDIFTGWMLAGRAALTSPVLPAQLRELIILRTVHLMASPYAVAQHTAIAERAGVGACQRAALEPHAELSSAGFDETELRVLELVTEVITTKTATAENIHALRESLGDEALIEVLMVIARWSGLALMLNALDVDIDVDARFTPASQQDPKRSSWWLRRHLGCELVLRALRFERLGGAEAPRSSRLPIPKALRIVPSYRRYGWLPALSSRLQVGASLTQIRELPSGKSPSRSFRQWWEDPLFTERTTVGLDACRSVAVAAFSGVTGEVFKVRNYSETSNKIGTIGSQNSRTPSVSTSLRVSHWIWTGMVT